MNQEQKTYPEQETPARPTYEAVIRGIKVGGWLYYAATGKQLTIIVTADGNRVTAEEFCYDGEGDELANNRQRARQKAKNLWRNVVVAILAGV